MLYAKLKVIMSSILSYALKVLLTLNIVTFAASIHSTPHPSIESSSNPTITCKDDDNFKLGYPPWEDVAFCRYIRRREERRVSWCLEPGVHDGCPYTCGLCCRDDPLYTFVNDIGDEKDCKWLSQENAGKENYCDKYKNGSMVRYACADTCDYCEEYVSFAPSSS